MNDIDQLRNIWQNIPKTTTHQLDISQNEMINRYMDIFHFGECFYVIFNTRTSKTSPSFITSSFAVTLKVIGKFTEEDFLT